MSIVLDIFFTFIEGCSILYMVKNEKFKRSRQILFLFLFIFIFCGITQIFTLSEMDIKTVFTYGVPILMGIFILGMPIKKSVFYMGISMFLLILSELLIIQIGVLLHINSGSGEDTSIPIIHAVISKIIYITLLIIVQKIISDINMKKFNMKSLFFFIFSNIGFMVVGICIYANITYIQSRVYSNVFLLCSITMLIALIINILFSNRYLMIESMEQENKMEIYGLEIQTRYYEERLKEEEQIKEIYHDMKNHLLLLEIEENKKYSEKMASIRREIMKYEDFYRTGNKFLDIILKDKVTKALQQDIRIDDNIDLSNIDFFEPFDISTIFGNLLDNAIEACLCIEEKGKRNISISAKRENGLLGIRVKNNKVNRGYSKSKKVIHGYGLVNVKNVVHKYNGEIDINDGASEFCVNIVIPIKKEKEAKKNEKDYIEYIK